ncbi:MAG: hypothetical protein NT062_21585, partial [Proteobacteria bacterium]|nr:hypothetical protein [Pseudomonadota bacterium]
MDERLRNAIGTARQAADLVGFSLLALDHLRQLDESLYERFVESRNAPADPVEAAAKLTSLWEHTFAGLLELLAFCRSLESSRPSTEVVSEAPVSFDWDLENSGVSAPVELELGSNDIGDLLEGIDEGLHVGDTERWAKVLEKVGSIEYGLRSQYTDAHTRLGVALAAGETNQILGLLDDTQSSSSEGVHALVAAVYGEFLPDVNAATLVPGHPLGVFGVADQPRDVQATVNLKFVANHADNGYP